MTFHRTNRLAVVAGFPPDPYGEAHYAGMAYTALAEMCPDLDVLVIAHWDGHSSRIEERMPNLTVCRITRPQGRIRATVALFAVFLKLLRFRPRVVHFQGVHTPRYGGIFGESATVLLIVLRALGFKCVYTAHSIWMPDELNMLWRQKGIWRSAGDLLTTCYAFNLQLVSKFANILSFVVAGTKSPMPASYASVYRLNAKCVTAEVHPCTVTPTGGEQARGERNECLTFGAVGFVREDKAYHLILDAASELLPTYDFVRILIAGEPVGANGRKYAQRLEAMRAAIPEGERIALRFEYLTDEDFAAVFSEIDIAIVPYSQVMGPSGPIHYALGYGKPVIASRTGHNLGLDGVCMLFQVNSSRSLARAMRELIENPDVRESLIRQSREYGRAHTWFELSARYCAEYRSLGIDAHCAK